MSMTSHSNTLLPTSPQLIPGMSLSVCIALNCFASRSAALDEAAEFEAIFSVIPLESGGADRVVRGSWFERLGGCKACAVESLASPAPEESLKGPATSRRSERMMQ